MKKEYLLFAALFFVSISCPAQLNELTQTEYYGIKINNVTFRKIYDTNADLTKMRALFGSDMLYEFNNDILISKQFWIDDFTINFDSDTGDKYYVTFININSSSARVTVKGVTVKLGDDKSVFGNNVVINTNKRDNSIVFIDQLTGAAALAFKINKKTNKITEIEFNAYD